MTELQLDILFAAIIVVIMLLGQLAVYWEARRIILFQRREIASKDKCITQLRSQLAEVDEYVIAGVRQRKQLGPDEWPDIIGE